MNPITIDVTISDIAAGKDYTGVYDMCPISQAMLRHGYSQLDVDEDRILFTTKDGQRYFCKTPRNASLFIDDFDNDVDSKRIVPFSFVLSDLRLSTISDERQSKTGVNYL